VIDERQRDMLASHGELCTHGERCYDCLDKKYKRALAVICLQKHIFDVLSSEKEYACLESLLGSLAETPAP